MTPYTYFLMWKLTGHKYYGCQYGKHASPENILNKTYRTSSKYVKQHWEQYGDPDIIVIHRTFESATQCREFEHKYLTRVNAIRKPDWLNRTNNRAICTDNYNQESWKKSHKSRKNHMDTDPEFRARIKAHVANIMGTEQAMIKRKETFKKIKHCQGENNPRYGVTLDNDLKQKISSARKQQVELNRSNARKLNEKKFICEHCNLALAAGNYRRWHGDKCSRK